MEYDKKSMMEGVEQIAGGQMPPSIKAMVEASIRLFAEDGDYASPEAVFADFGFDDMHVLSMFIQDVLVPMSKDALKMDVKFKTLDPMYAACLDGLMIGLLAGRIIDSK